MVDVEFKIISIGEIKEASMVRDKSLPTLSQSFSKQTLFGFFYHRNTQWIFSSGNGGLIHGWHIISARTLTWQETQPR